MTLISLAWQVVILTDSGSGVSGVCRMDLLQTRNTKLTGGLWMNLLYQFSKFDEDGIYGISVMPPHTEGV